jgi:hypothetical protein
MWQVFLDILNQKCYWNFPLILITYILTHSWEKSIKLICRGKLAHLNNRTSNTLVFLVKCAI